MRVDPQRVVELAGRCDEAVHQMTQQWGEVCDDLRGACGALGESSGAAAVTSAYEETLTAADEATWALARALAGGVAALIDAARDVSQADETVAVELGRTAGEHGLQPGRDSAGVPRGRGHGRGGVDG